MRAQHKIDFIFVILLFKWIEFQYFMKIFIKILRKNDSIFFENIIEMKAIFNVIWILFQNII